MKLLQEKLSKYDAPQRAMAAGIYPYFRMIESDQDTEVMISGKKVLMFGSNSYLARQTMRKRRLLMPLRNMVQVVPVRVS